MPLEPRDLYRLTPRNIFRKLVIPSDGEKFERATSGVSSSANRTQAALRKRTRVEGLDSRSADFCGQVISRAKFLADEKLRRGDYVATASRTRFNYTLARSIAFGTLMFFRALHTN